LARPAARWGRPGEFSPGTDAGRNGAGAQQARGAGGFIAAGLPLSQQRLIVAATLASDSRDDAAIPRPSSNPDGRRSAYSPPAPAKGIEKLFDSCEILFHIASLLVKTASVYPK
jgi:hypothetical protein